MLFWIALAAAVIGLTISWCVICDHEVLSIISGVIGAFGAVIVCISLIIFPFEYIGVDAQVEKYKIRYDSLVYQYENDFYENDNDVGKRELITDILKWNEDLAYRKKIQYDPWVGIYWADIYDQFEFISLEK